MEWAAYRIAAFDFLRENILNTDSFSAPECTLRTNCTFRWVARTVAQHLGTGDPKNQLQGD